MKNKNACPLLFLLLALACGPKREFAEQIYFNGNLWTGDSTLSSASVVGVRNGKIIYVGNDPKAVRGPYTQMEDLEGRLMLPGLIDNHTHFLEGGLGMAAVQLKSADSPREFIARIRRYVQQRPGQDWVLQGNWNHELWGGILPHKNWIDSVSGGHPVFVIRYDGHMALANSKALALAGINKKTKDPYGGTIVRDSKGEPTGILKDAAMDLVAKWVPPPSEKTLAIALDSAMQNALSHGVTAVHDMGSFGGFKDIAVYQQAQKENRLRLRVYAFVPLSQWEALDSFCKKNGRGNDYLQWGGLKGFVDGSLGSGTAWFYQPYLDAPNTNGFTVNDTTQLYQWIKAADKAGMQVAVHAIGDQANDVILRTFEKVSKENGYIDTRRFRVEHAQHLSPDAFQAFANNNIIASVQPYHLVDDGSFAHKRLRPDQLSRTYAFKSMLDNGVTMGFGSDWFVAPLNPFLGIWAAVNRETSDGKNPNGWYPEQRIMVKQALTAYTAKNALAGFQEKKWGMIREGLMADLVILKDNILLLPSNKIAQARVYKTLVNGKTVYSSKN